MTDLEKKIIDTIKNIDEISDENLVHYFKCINSKVDKKEKLLYLDLFKAIEKERKKRGSAKAVESEDLDVQANKELQQLEEETERLANANEQKDNEY